MRKILIYIFLMLGACQSKAQDIISLSGEWEFAVGETPYYKDYIVLPGSMLTNDKGNPVDMKTQWTGSLYDSSFYFNPYMEKYRVEGNIKFPFFLTPEKHYVGAAWYRKSVYVPTEWAGQPVFLFLERPHIETTVFVNGHSAGHDLSLSTPHRYDLTNYIKAGERNDIVIRVYNGIENVCVGQDSHSVTDQTQGNWNGIIGRIELQAGICIWRKEVIPNLKDHTVDIVINEHVFHAQINPEAELWDEFTPKLHTVVVQYNGWDVPVTFGLREVSIKGRQLFINGHPLFLRGTVENCCFPETGYPPTDEEEWMRAFTKIKEYGLNHVRFHSYCPPEAAFNAADRLGIYLQVEGPSWPNHGVRLRRGQKIDEYLLEESKRIINEYGSHPSFIMMAAGNEPAGDWVPYCNEWVKQMSKYDKSKIYAGASVGGGWAWDNGSQYHVKGGARGLEWDRHAPSSDDDYFDQIEFPRNYKESKANNSPIIAHEQGQWCAFPDFKEISQYVGAYKPGNFEIFRDLLARNGMASQAEKFLHASGKLQVLCYKYEMERNLRTKDYAGFQLLSLNDYSGQGTALVGPLNVHWQEKGYTTAREWRESCNSIVVMARFPKFVYTSDERLVVPVEMMNAIYGDLRPCNTTYEIIEDGKQLFFRDSFSPKPVPLGKNTQMGVIDLPLDRVTKPTKMTLHLIVENRIENHYNFWVYPASKANHTSQFSVLNSPLTPAALDTLRAGGTVLIEAAGLVTLGSDVKQTYLPVFWNTSWFKMRPPHTTGAYIDTSHPLFKYDFPTDDWADLQWWELLNRAQVMNLMELPADYQPPIQPIDTWHVSRKLGMLIEARVLGGRLLMTTMDISTDLAHRPVARQMRHAILAYMQSPDFQPAITLDPETIEHFFTRQAPPVDMFTRESPDELKPKLN